ncbi:ferric reductase-like transmembrane domain-containing protein [Gallibacterium salpingitidis]|uniref:Ferric oxidoreductase domain-containing protein n=1 Tax=Gallibacterium salpingitidis TaxID=505341 RepID=A0A1A7NYZ3_9PAST|nr:ferric reductase-like transmembrane domain-containing protein [Gallibacterium salpingitidis]OBW94716.1 hypothetical protein QS62_05750 [Gallibacterium salpingitidis]
MLFRVIRYLIHFSGVATLLWLIYAVNFNFAVFGADPIKEIIHFLGYTALIFFLVLFSFRMIVQLTHQNILLPLHRSLGLWGIFWLTLHILSYLGLELGFDTKLFFNEIFTRTYLQIGLLSGLIFSLVATSSIPIIKRRLKKHWFQLHQFALLAVILATLHYFLSLKAYNFDSRLFLGLVALFALFKFFPKGQFKKSPKR